MIKKKIVENILAFSMLFCIQLAYGVDARSDKDIEKQIMSAPLSLNEKYRLATSFLGKQISRKRIDRELQNAQNRLMDAGITLLRLRNMLDCRIGSDNRRTMAQFFCFSKFSGGQDFNIQDFNLECLDFEKQPMVAAIPSPLKEYECYSEDGKMLYAYRAHPVEHTFDPEAIYFWGVDSFAHVRILDVDIENGDRMYKKGLRPFYAQLARSSGGEAFNYDCDLMIQVMPKGETSVLVLGKMFNV